jgi:hypothetical protein
MSAASISFRAVPAGLGRTAARLVPDLVVLAAAISLIYVSTRPTSVAEALGFGPDPAGNRVFWFAVIGSVTLLMVLIGRLIHALYRRGRNWRMISPDDRGIVATEFLLAMVPLFWMLLLICHMSVVANCGLIVQYSAFTAARAAAVSYGRTTAIQSEEFLPANRATLEDAADLILCILSPYAPLAPAQNHGASAMQRIFTNQNFIWGTNDFPRRMMYTRIASNITFTESYPESTGAFPRNPALPPPRRITATVRYFMIVRIPAISVMPGLTVPAPFGGGRAVTLEGTATVQSTGGRQAAPAAMVGGFPPL